MGLFGRGKDEEPEERIELDGGTWDDAGDDYAGGTRGLAELIAPESMLVAQDHVKVGDEYCRTLFAVDYPTIAEPNFLAPLFKFAEAMDVSVFIQPLPTKQVVDRLRSKIARDEARLLKDEESGIVPNFKVQKRHDDNLGLVQAIEQDLTKPFQVSLMITLRAKRLDELDEMTEALERRLTMLETRRANLRMRDGYISTLPAMNNRLSDIYSTRNMHTQGLQMIFPFTSADLCHEEGVLYGVNVSTHGNIIVNRFAQPSRASARTTGPEAGTVTNPGMAVLGTSGSGKSYFCKTEMLRWAMLGAPVVVVDPQNEYDRLCAGVGGQFINIALDSPDKINPLDFSHSVAPDTNALAQKIVFMGGMIQVMLRAGRNDAPPLTEYQRSLIDEALTILYERYGYSTRSPESQLSARPDAMPTLSELHEVFSAMQRARRSEHDQNAIIPLVVGLRPYVGEGSLAGLFDNPSTVDLRNDFVVFNVQSLGDDLLPVGMHVVLEFLRTSLFTHAQQKSGRQRLLYVDEAQRLMKFPETASFLEFTARTARKFGVGFTVMTQDVEVFLLNEDGTENKFGIGVLQNCATTVLLRQHQNATKAVQRVFHLTDAEVRYLATAKAGEGIIFVDDDRALLSAVDLTSPLEHQMITTTASEVAQISQAGGQITPGNSPGLLPGGGR